MSTSGNFLITIPVTEENENSCERVKCVSGDTLSNVVNPDGCEVMKKKKKNNKRNKIVK